MSGEHQDVLLTVKELRKWFPIQRGFMSRTVGHIKAVDDVSLTVYRGENFGIVGESGSGKTTLARTMLRLIEPTSGEIIYDGKVLTDMRQSEIRSLRKGMQIIFQDPFGSLHPKMRIGTIIEEPLLISGVRDKEVRRKRVEELIVQVGLKTEHLSRFPHEFSGGQRQRIVIARALATNPDLVICDEPVSALDVSVRSQILNLLQDLQKELNLTYLFISHDLSVVEHMCDRIAVLYLGQLVELGTKEQIFHHMLHPYTQALMSAIPLIDGDPNRERIELEGDIPSPSNPPEGCRFQTRCRYACERCRQTPEFRDAGNGHFVACHRYQEFI